MHKILLSAKKRRAAFWLASVLPVATAAIAALSGCGSGHGTSYINPPLTGSGVAPSSVLPTAFPSGVSPTISPSGFPTASPSASTSASASPSPSGGASTAYTATDVGQTVGDATFRPVDLNGTGQFVGTRNEANNVGKFITYVTVGGVLTRVGEGYPSALGEGGQVVGDNDGDGFLYENGTLHGLGTLGGKTYPEGVNRKGQVMGRSDLDSGGSISHAFLYENGAIQDLGTLPGGTSSSALGINDNGVIVGYSVQPSTGVGARPIIYENGQMREIPAIGGGSKTGIAYAVNNRGQVVGSSQVAEIDGISHAFLYENGTTRDLGTLGGRYARATDINDSGVVVGYSDTADQTRHAFVVENGALIDLNSYNPDPRGTTQALAVNNNGQILLLVSSVRGTETYLVLTPSGRKR